MNDNKLIFSLVIGIIVLFGIFMLLTGDEQEVVDVVVSNEPLQQEAPVIFQVETPVAEDILIPEMVEDITDMVEEVIGEEVIGQEVADVLDDVATVLEPVEDLIAEVVTEVTEPEPVEPAIPDLNNSDDFIIGSLANIAGGSPLLSYLVADELIRKFVIMIENISHGDFPERNLPLLNPRESMSVTELGNEFYLIDEQSYHRFNDLVTSLTNISTDTAVDLYRQLLPLFDEAYAELGIRNSNFRDVFMQALDNILNARTAPQPQQLIRPNLNYLYADPEIENYSDVEKLLLRLGSENSANLQRRLEFFKRRLELDTALGN